MTFLKDFRRRSKASLQSLSLELPFQRNGDNSASKGSSTPDSSSRSSRITPPSSISAEASSSLLPVSTNSNTSSAHLSPPQRPVPITSQSTRSSAATSVSANGCPRVAAPTSPYAPKVVSISDNSWVHQKVLLIYGQIGNPNQISVDGTLSVIHNHESFSSITWPVCDSHFKALLHLTPGPNKLRLDFASSKVPNPTLHSSWISINYLPLANMPPLQLAIILGKDSDGTVDANPDNQTDLSTAISKFRMAAYLWQAFTGEQMFRNNFGRRCFRLEEEWQPGTISSRDAMLGQMRNEAKVHVIRCDKTVSELRRIAGAQQGCSAENDNELFHTAMDAVTRYFDLQPGQNRYVSALFLDTHVGTTAQVATNHSAPGSSAGDVKLAIFGSQAIRSYPSCLEEVVPAFTDCARSDAPMFPNDGQEYGSNWEVLNYGIGGHLHQVGHMLGCSHGEDGIMTPDYSLLNRTFITRETYSTRTKSPGLRPCLPTDECSWHRLDTLRFRFHPCFRLPSDVPAVSGDDIQAWPVDNGKVLITCASGIAFIEIYSGDDEVCKSFMDYVNGDSGNCGIPKQIMLTESKLRERISEPKKAKGLRLKIFSGSLSTLAIEDICQVKSKQFIVKLPNGQAGYRGMSSPRPGSAGALAEELILDCASTQTKLLTTVKIYHDAFITALEFCYEDSTSQVFGKRTGLQSAECDATDIRRGEALIGFLIKSGPSSVSGIEILTSLGRKTGVLGSAVGESSHTLIPPRGYGIAGISGSVDAHIETLSLIITR
ncbi:hypothetical protein AJ80_04323 [Polytolypa hystricis UAMH7299]|uniref:Jacalin-type lectin domain-containing protein n=1 Tax=Polytolypa hystricis (strain UAMH7299) TaxID=1447883 RepID=A0A2B7Y468_POLH7|nr:hypothetical protein AJ80_04323 [Polytolypa hystricis UAMH7299]